MENENGLSRSFSAGRWFRLKSIGTQKELFNGGGRIDVESTGDVPTTVLIIKPTVDDVVRRELAIIHSV